MAEKFAKVMIFVLIMIRCVRKPHHYQFVVMAWLCGVFYIGYEAFGEAGVRHGGRLARGLDGPDFAESSGLSVHLVATLPLIGAMFFMVRRWWSRGLILLVGALTVNTIIMTRTRNAVFGLVAMSVVALHSLPRGYRWKGWVAFAIGTFLALRLTDPGWWSRMSTLHSYEEDNSAVARLECWAAAVQMAKEFPLGIGLGNFHDVVKDYVPNLDVARSAHSTYFACLAELGYPGLTLFLTVLGVTLWRLRRIRKQADRMPSDLPIDVEGWQIRFHLGWHALALQCALVGYLASAMFTSRGYAEDLWILLGLSACLDNVKARIGHGALAESRSRAYKILLSGPKARAALADASAVPPRAGQAALQTLTYDRTEPALEPALADTMAEGGTGAGDAAPDRPEERRSEEPAQDCRGAGDAIFTTGAPTEDFTSTGADRFDWSAALCGPAAQTLDAVESIRAAEYEAARQTPTYAAAAPGPVGAGAEHEELPTTVDPEGCVDLDEDDAAFVDMLIALGNCLLFDSGKGAPAQNPVSDCDIDLSALPELMGTDEATSEDACS